MTEVSDKELINLIKEKFPKFIPYWEDYDNYWNCDEDTISDKDIISDEDLISEMIPFVSYVVEVIKSNDTLEIKKIFDFVEFLMSNGNELVQTAIATGFLEYLLSKDPDEIQFIKFRQYLGHKTIEYCRAWDRFTGVYTKGLHDDET